MNKLKYIFAILLSACGFATTEPSRFYALYTPSTTQITGPTKLVKIGIDDISVPQAVDRPQMVIKEHDSTLLRVSDFNRWIENLDKSLPIILSEDMNTYAKNISARPVSNANVARNMDYILSVDFIKFETEQNADITLSAWWTITNQHGDILVQKRNTFSAKTPSDIHGKPDYEQIVAVQSKLIANLAYKIVNVVSGL